MDILVEIKLCQLYKYHNDLNLQNRFHIYLRYMEYNIDRFQEFHMDMDSMVDC